MSHQYPFILILLITLISGCSGLVQEGSGQAPVQDHGAEFERGSMQQPPSGNAGNRYIAVSGLLQQANQYDQRGQYARAAASLERALRISPRDAWIWYRLATVRMKQGHYVQAESMAKKSLSLPGIPLKLKISNWELIKDAAEKQGRQSGVLHARQKLLQLRQQEE